MDEQEKVRVSRYLEQYVSPIGKRIYSYIEESGQKGMTKTDLRKRTNLPVKQLDDQLLNMKNYSLIKSIKKPEKKNLNIWVLFHENTEQLQQEQKVKNEDLISLIVRKDNENISTIKKQALKKNIQLNQFDEILQMLVMKGDIIVSEDKVKIRSMNKIKVPCMTCQLRRLCEPGGAISPESCLYLSDW